MVGKHWTEAEDRLLLGLGERESLARLAARTGRSAAAVRCRLSLLRRRQLPPRGGPTRDWTEEDLATLRSLVGRRSVEAIAATLGRTPTAVRVRLKRLGLRQVKRAGRTVPGLGYTAREVAALLGVRCSKTVGRWIRAGWLVATQRPIRYGAHLIWRVEASDLEDFLRDYRWLYDPARIVDRGWAAFVAALPGAGYVGTAEAARLLPYTRGGIVQLIARGDLAAERWGSGWRIPVAAIRAFTPPPFGYGARVSGASDVAARRRATLAAQRSIRWTRKSAARATVC